MCSSSSMASERRASEGDFGIPVSDSASGASTGMAGGSLARRCCRCRRRHRPGPPARSSAVTRVPAPRGVSPGAARGHCRRASPWQPGGRRATAPSALGTPRSFTCGLLVGCSSAAPPRPPAVPRAVPAPAAAAGPAELRIPPPGSSPAAGHLPRGAR